MKPLTESQARSRECAKKQTLPVSLRRSASRRWKGYDGRAEVGIRTFAGIRPASALVGDGKRPWKRGNGWGAGLALSSTT